MTIMTIDFEASCLPRHGRSFPIEVGIATPVMSRSWLIRPTDEWLGWDWTAEAEALHNLTRDRVLREGLPAAQVLAELAQTVGNCRLVSDSSLDRYWLDRLAEAAGKPAPFAIDHAGSLFDEAGTSSATVAAAIARASAQVSARHRASADALWLAHVLDHALAPEPAPMMEAAQ
ncbi:hypothetical protein SAMIE_1020420 [Sphingobium amiense]|uniref:Exonuclease domain-containing protein n=2 Tax=Sphingobium amiense TaxID=135719 RepID=A0A494W2W4_9SPHN|nr:hypothetical protein [Sphingobium amiense]BBD98541.1 hypothetical protein SAMIE_1020420 [Sphingobium amiense]